MPLRVLFCSLSPKTRRPSPFSPPELQPRCIQRAPTGSSLAGRAFTTLRPSRAPTTLINPFPQTFSWLFRGSAYCVLRTTPTKFMGLLPDPSSRPHQLFFSSTFLFLPPPRSSSTRNPFTTQNVSFLPLHFAHLTPHPTNRRLQPFH